MLDCFLFRQIEEITGIEICWIWCLHQMCILADPTWNHVCWAWCQQCLKIFCWGSEVHIKCCSYNSAPLWKLNYQTINFIYLQQVNTWDKNSWFLEWTCVCSFF